MKARIVGDTGAYASVGEAVLQRAAGHACSAYRVDNVDVEGRAVYTNNPPCGAMRGFGSNQANFAMEGCVDRLAELVGLDPWEMRWRNAVEVGDRFGTGQVLGSGVGVKRTLEAVKPVWDEARAAGRAVGLACGVKNTGIGNGLPETARAVIRVDDDGGVTVFHQWTEMGQGVHTVLQQVACTELGLPPSGCGWSWTPTHELDGGQTTASRGSVLGGVAIIEAARLLKAELNGAPDGGPGRARVRERDPHAAHVPARGLAGRGTDPLRVRLGHPGVPSSTSRVPSSGSWRATTWGRS